MKKIEKAFIELLLPFIVAWLLMTAFIDIIVVPTVFRNSSSIIDAGKIGMMVFGTFNAFEVLFAIYIFLGASFQKRIMPKSTWLFFAVPLLVLAFVYKMYMTPMITNTTYEIHKTKVEDPQYLVLQSRHAQFHNLYKYTDSAKMLVLLVFAVVVLRDRVKERN